MVNYRISYDEKKKYFRSFSKTYPKYDYLNNKEKIVMNPIGCHDGQRKLLYSEIEFYTELSKSYNLNEILVVYVGSGHGIHQPLIFDMFPELDFFMCDPSKFDFNHKLIYDKTRFYFLKDYYTNQSYKIVEQFNKKNKKIAFICDIREDTDELDVFNNMKSQQKWCIQLNSIAYLLKFRLPLINKGFKYEYFNYSISLNIKNKVIIKKFRKPGFKYLTGKVLIQIYAPLMSTESRLLYIRKSSNEKFKFENYDIEKYNMNCYYFNLYDRYKIYSYKESNKLPQHILGFDNGYESVTEYYIIYHYIKEYLKEEPTIKKIIEIIFLKITNNSQKYHKYYKYSRIESCCLKIIDKKIKKYYKIIYKYLDVLKLNIKNNNIEKIFILLSQLYNKKMFIRLDQAKKYIITIKSSLKEQQEYFNKGTILETNDYIYQYNMAEIYLKSIDSYYSKLIKLINMLSTISNINKLLNNNIKLPMQPDNINKILHENQQKKIKAYKKNVPKTKNNYFKIRNNNNNNNKNKLEDIKKILLKL